MKIELPNPKQLGRKWLWPRHFLTALSTMPEAEYGNIQLQTKLSPHIREQFAHEEEELLALAGVTKEEWPKLVAEHSGSAKDLFWELELVPVNRSYKRKTALKCPTQIGNLQHSQYTLQMLVNGKRVAINTKEYSNFNHYGAHEFDLVLDCQYDPSRNWPKNVVPFTMFANNMPNFHQHVDKYRKIVQKTKKRWRVGWRGFWWRERHKYLYALQDHEKIFIEGNWKANGKPRFSPGRGTRKAHDFVGPTYREYVEQAATWEWALVLYGKGSNAKGNHNQREHEFAALGIPQILNYQPTYYVPFERDVHYVRATRPKHVAWLANSGRNGKEIADNAYDYWQRYMSTEGICNLFKRICREHL